MLVLQHVEQLAGMASKALGKEVPYSTIKPVTFGFRTNWGVAGLSTLASLQVPRNRRLIVLRTETYTVNYTVGSTDYNSYGVPPLGRAYWIRANDTSQVARQVLTPKNAPSHLMLDVDCLLSFPGNSFANLIGDLDTPPDGLARKVNVNVYGYLVGAEIADAITAMTAGSALAF